MTEANITAILKVIEDPSCMVLMPHMDDREERLEKIMPEEEMPSGSEVITQNEDIEDLSPEQKALLIELFDDLEVGHDHLGRACST